MKFHPAAEMFPMMDAEDLDTLASDIKSHGQQVPIRTLNGLILDGRNRFIACQKAKVSAIIEPWIPLNGETPVQFVISQNLHRRHLNQSQRAMVAASISALLQGEKRGNVGNPTFEQGEAAKLLNVSRDSVIQARKVDEKAAPEVIKAVESGKVSVNDAAAISDKPKSEQRAALKKVETGKAKTLRQAIAAETEDVLCDELKVPVPPGIAPVFHGAVQFRAILNQFKEIKAAARKLAESPAGRLLRLQAFESDLDNARRTIRFDMPYAVCPVCKGSAKTRRTNCPCKNMGWLNESNYNVLPSEFRK